MLGETGLQIPMVSQAAWINSLKATYIKSWENRRGGIGGLFGAPRGSETLVLPWNRAQQAAHLICVGVAMRAAVKEIGTKWASQLRRVREPTLFDKNDDPAFYGRHSLLSTDQGIRGLLYATNDLFWQAADALNLSQWTSSDKFAATDEEAVTSEIKAYRRLPAYKFLQELTTALAAYD